MHMLSLQNTVVLFPLLYKHVAPECLNAKKEFVIARPTFDLVTNLFPPLEFSLCRYLFWLTGFGLTREKQPDESINMVVFA